MFVFVKVSEPQSIPILLLGNNDVIMKIKKQSK